MAQECAEKEVVHLAGFSGDGYFTRAKQTLAKLGLNWKAHDRYTRHGYEDWVMDFEETKANGRALHHKSSTLVWLEDPLLVWGDSDELERYWELGANRPSMREYGDSKVFAQTQVWKQATAQAIVCSNSRRQELATTTTTTTETAEEEEGVLDFHLVLYKEWHAKAYELLVGSFDPLHLSHVQTNRFGWIKMALDVNHAGSRLDPGDNNNRDMGTVLTNGTTIRILTKDRLVATNANSDLLLTGFVSVGIVPQRDLQRRMEQGWAEQYACRFLPNGINYVLALDRLGEAGF
ncbi:hypothetical protein BASA81_003549 [Batrachochytrium salamandrivorans]|nr:hypothetical protein BASA81_003549 [Batrachochytrium salamandrivorans]